MYNKNTNFILKKYFGKYKKFFISKNSVKIPSYLCNKVILLDKGLFRRLIQVNFYMVGLSAGTYASTKRLYNFIVFKGRKRR